MASRINKNKKIAILTSGGDASGMNAAIRAAVRYSLNQGYEVYGVRQGYLGLINDSIFKMDYKSVSNSVHAGGTILRTGRSKDFIKKEVMLAAVDNLLKRDIRNLIVIGGDGSFRAAEDMHQNTELNIIGVPATIDNDMGYTDYTIGFDTACNTVIDAILKLRDTITSHDRIMILEVMGRHCGEIALNAAVAGGAEYCIIPEFPVVIEEIAQSVSEGFIKNEKTSTIIVLAEGCNEMKDELMARVSDLSGRRVNHVSLSYMQRGGNPTMSDRVLAARLSVRAVDLITCGQSGRVVGVRGGDMFDMNIIEALNVKKDFDESLYDISQILSK